MTASVLSAVLDVLSEVANWVVESLGTLTSMFYSEGSLTFFGVLAIAGLGVSMCLMLLNIIQNFLQFRG